MQNMCLSLGVEVPYETASELLKTTTGQSISGRQIERICKKYGAMLDSPPIVYEESRYGTQLYLFTDEEPVCTAMVDGSMIFTREESWKEVKAGRIDLCESKGSTKSVYYASLASCEPFFEIWNKQLAAIPVQPIFIADGAPWIWRKIETYYPESPQILDYYHLSKHLNDFAKQAFRKKAERELFLETCKKDLFNDDVNACLTRIENIQVPQKKEKEKLLGYLTMNQERITYGKFQKNGWPIGSGAIESTHKTLVQARLKRSGQRWSVKGAQALLNLKMYKNSGKWDDVKKQLVSPKFKRAC
jgi:hypothetical protein